MSVNYDPETKAFQTAAHWRRWLTKNHAASSGTWLQIFKKGSGVNTVSYAEALDEALCFGWIDGQKNAYDAASDDATGQTIALSHGLQKTARK